MAGGLIEQKITRLLVNNLLRFLKTHKMEAGEAEMSPVKDMSEAAAHFGSTRAGKASHLTRTMNIINSLMESDDHSCLKEVKANKAKYNELLEDFKAQHAAYGEMLDGGAKREDNEKWYHPVAQGCKVNSSRNPLSVRKTSFLLQEKIVRAQDQM